ncbi:hypothetical protein [Fulvivirga sediminis]|uniref:T9SS C-terminal target domain-containing protein n=1 Tax=Fulvivirga sediminis TaxID=2803949 RepID=A0A937K2S7_9BACT|nr:hypothetical protein [Fulvivirga sediminis]MBL3658931.1 hypothetical protein [Fulvivirga sediminis]
MKNYNFQSLSLVIIALISSLFATSCQDELSDNQLKGEGTAEQAIITLSGSLTTQTLSSSNTYILDGFVRVPSGVTLSIPAGTVIKGLSGTLSGNPATGTAPGTLIVERGGKIYAEGSANNPVVFTSNKANPAAGDWGGIIVLGKAPVCYDGTTIIEGIPTGNGIDRGYGGNNSADDSGILRYVRIEYAGNVLVDGDETNGLTLGGVGSGTTLSHVEVYKGKDDGFEFFGGTVNADHLIAAYNVDDDFDTDQGYSGTIQYGIAIRDKDIFSSYPTGSFESNGDNDDATGCAYTNAKFYNFTVIGPIGPNTTSLSTAALAAYNSAAIIRDGSELDIYNSILVGYPNYQLELETPSAFGNTVNVEGVTLVSPSYNSFSAQCSNVANLGSTVSCLSAISSGTGRGSLVVLSGLKTKAWNPSSVLDFQPNSQKAGINGGFQGAIGATSTAGWNSGWEKF